MHFSATEPCPVARVWCSKMDNCPQLLWLPPKNALRILWKSTALVSVEFCGRVRRLCLLTFVVPSSSFVGDNNFDCACSAKGPLAGANGQLLRRAPLHTMQLDCHHRGGARRGSRMDCYNGRHLPWNHWLASVSGAAGAPAWSSKWLLRGTVVLILIFLLFFFDL
jgi:hypothetical protein